MCKEKLKQLHSYVVLLDAKRAYSLLESNIRSASRKILKELQPYTVTKSIKLLETKTKDKEQ